MHSPNKFAIYAATAAVAVSPAGMVNAELQHQQCEDSALPACRGLGPHPLHTLEDGPQFFVLSTATHTSTGSNTTITPNTGALGSFVSTAPQIFETPAPFIQLMPAGLQRP